MCKLVYLDWKLWIFLKKYFKKHCLMLSHIVIIKGHFSKRNFREVSFFVYCRTTVFSYKSNLLQIFRRVHSHLLFESNAKLGVGGKTHLGGYLCNAV